MATYRLVMNAFPKAATTASGPRPPAIPVARPAIVTTSSGLIRRTNPMTTMTMPTRVSIDAVIVGIACFRRVNQSNVGKTGNSFDERGPTR